MHAHHYRNLLIMLVLSFASMYIFMYAMVNASSNIYPNINQFYMAGVMTAPMVLIELAVMRGMYTNTRLNLLIATLSAIALLAFLFGIREQVAVSDTQFLKSMIPHHAGAILMCEKNTLKDAELNQLCATIVKSQRAEIAQMKAKLDSLAK